MNDMIQINEDLKFSMDSQLTKLNNNYAFVGAPGTYKTTLEAFNILQMNEHSHVIVDVKGSFMAMKSEFEKQGYNVQQINLIDLSSSQTYNPLSYIRENHVETDIATIANAIIKPSLANDPFWDNCSRALIRSLIAYSYYALDEDEITIKSLCKLLQLAQDREMGQSSLNILFDDFSRQFGSDHYAVRQFKGIDVESDKTMSCIITSAYSHLADYDNEEVFRVLSSNQIDFRRLGEEKSLLIISLKDYDSSLHRIAGLLLTQLFQSLIEQANHEKNLRLSVPVQFWLDDFGSYYIHDFEAYISCARSRNIGISMLFQSEGQLIANYNEHKARTIIQCADTYLYLGGNDDITVQHICRRSEHVPSYVYSMLPGEVYVLRRGMETIKTKLIKFDNYPQYCLWNYQNDCIPKRNYQVKHDFGMYPEVSQETYDLLLKCDYKLCKKKLENYIDQSIYIQKDDSIFQLVDILSQRLLISQSMDYDIHRNTKYPIVITIDDLTAQEISLLYEDNQVEAILYQGNEVKHSYSDYGENINYISD